MIFTECIELCFVWQRSKLINITTMTNEELDTITIETIVEDIFTTLSIKTKERYCTVLYQ